ncbi:ABC transporter ATP-binding protein [Bacillus sp. JJ1562]|uniref:ABC transporter ATP-binding protein n=1 Tax=Bacillus sp. JJ1562 TaxID=3122960 RepID=UPI003002E340
MKDIAIAVDNIAKKFGDQTVLNGVSYEFERGKIHGIVGNNGSGKTVMMKCICGFLAPDSGSIQVNGKTIGKDVDFPPDIGMIIETPGFLPNLTGVKNLMLLASLRNIVTMKGVKESIRRVDLDPELKKTVAKYSLGMRQRLGIAQAIMENPSVLILDEPFNGLDKHSAAHIRVLIKELCEQGTTILLASHNQIDIDELCDSVAEMDAGNLHIVRTQHRNME